MIPPQLFHDGDRYHIETSPLTTASVMEQLSSDNVNLI